MEIARQLPVELTVLGIGMEIAPKMFSNWLWKMTIHYSSSEIARKLPVDHTIAQKCSEIALKSLCIGSKLPVEYANPLKSD